MKIKAGQRILQPRSRSRNNGRLNGVTAAPNVHRVDVGWMYMNLTSQSGGVPQSHTAGGRIEVNCAKVNCGPALRLVDQGNLEMLRSRAGCSGASLAPATLSAKSRCCRLEPSAPSASSYLHNFITRHERCANTINILVCLAVLL